MAKILRNETSLLRRQEAIRRELAFRQTTRLVVWGTVCLVAAWGLFATIRSGSFAGRAASVMVSPTWTSFRFLIPAMT